MEKYHSAVAAGRPWRYGKVPLPADQNKKRGPGPERRGPAGRSPRRGRGGPGESLGHRPGLPDDAGQERRLAEAAMIESNLVR
jgi:hypothetical protein